MSFSLAFNQKVFIRSKWGKEWPKERQKEQRNVHTNPFLSLFPFSKIHLLFFLFYSLFVVPKVYKELRWYPCVVQCHVSCLCVLQCVVFFLCSLFFEYSLILFLFHPFSSTRVTKMSFSLGEREEEKRKERDRQGIEGKGLKEKKRKEKTEWRERRTKDEGPKSKNSRGEGRTKWEI